MKEVAAFVAMEVTPEEMEEIIKRRELAAKNAAIEEKTQVLVKTIKEIENLGGRVRVTRDRKNTYFSSYGENIVDVRHSNPRFVEIVIT
jgi:hypothetical protein